MKPKKQKTSTPMKPESAPTCASVLKKVQALEDLGVLSTSFNLQCGETELCIDDESVYMNAGTTIILIDLQAEEGFLELLPRIDKHINSIIEDLKKRLDEIL